MSELAGKAYVEMSVKGKEEFAKAFSQMQANVRSFAARLAQTKMVPSSADMSKFFKSARSEFSDLIKQATKLGTVVGTAVGVTAVAALSSAIKKASDLQETMNKFEVVFADSAGDMETWGTTLAAQMGRSKQQVMDFMSQAQGLVVPMGVDPAAAQEMSQTLTQLAFDLASFHNSTDADAFEALRSALTGESEPMKKFGVIVNETATKAELLKKGLDPTTATEAQKAMARYNIILQGTTQAQGDVERSGSSFANRMKALQASIDDLSAGIGTQFLPIAEAMVGWLTELARSLGDTSGMSDSAAKSLENLASPAGIAADAASYLVKGFALVDLTLNTIMGTGRELMRMMIDLSKILINNPLSRGMFGKQAVDELMFVLNEVEQSTIKLQDMNRNRVDNAFDVLTDPNAGQKAIDDMNQFIEAQKRSYDLRKEQLKLAREEAQQDANRLKIMSQERVILKPKGVPDNRAAEAAKAQEELSNKVVSVANPQTLESTSLAAFERFRENQNNEQRLLLEKQLEEQKKISKALADPDLAIAEIG